MKRSLASSFNHWLQSPSGQCLVKIERKLLKKLKLPRSHACMVTVGEVAQVKLMKSFDAKQKVLVSHEAASTKLSEEQVVAEADELPIFPYCADLVLLPHTLDFGRHPHLILREANICLEPEGHLVVVGFNPYSLWGLRKLLGLRLHMPWRCRFLSPWKLRDWLAVMNYEVVIHKRAVYRPFARHAGLFKKMAFLESFLRLLFPFAGGVYIIVAKKKVFGVTPLKRSRWRRASGVLSGVGVPTSRSSTASREVND